MAAQTFPAQHIGMAAPHPGMPHGHQMGAGQHPGMGGPGPQMMHPGVSGAQVSQGGPMVTGMPQGAPTPAPGPMPNAHALSHLGPQQQMFPQGHPGQIQQFNPMLQHQIQMQAQRQAQQRQLMQQQMQGQHGHIPVTMPNGAQGMTPQQFAALRGQMPVQPGMQFQQIQGGGNPQQMHNPQHQQQIMAAQQQAQAQQAFAVQQAALHQQQAAQARNNQMMQEQNATTQAPQPQPTPAPQAAPPPQPTPQPQVSQPPSAQPPQQQQQQNAPAQPQNQGQQPPPQPQPQGQQGQGGPSVPTSQPGQNPQQAAQESQMQQQKMAMASQMRQPIMATMRGASILRVIQFCDHLSQSSSDTEKSSKLDTWQQFVSMFFTPEGVLRQQLWNSRDSGDKRYQLSVAALPRFYWSHFTSGIKHMDIHLERARESDLPSGGHMVEGRTTVSYVFENDSRLISFGNLKAHLDVHSKIEILDLSTRKHVEYLPRPLVEASVEKSPEQKSSPEINKKLKRAQKQAAQAAAATVTLPPSRVTKEWGVTSSVLQFFETAETMTSMTMLFAYCQDNPNLRPQEALEKLLQELRDPANLGIQPNTNPALQQMPAGQRTPGFNGPNAFASPAMAHLGLPQQGSPHVGAGHTPSPHASAMPGPVAMAHQQSQQGSNLSGSQGTSANTSPNVTNKKRRASAVKLEGEDGNAEVNGVGGAHKVKASPRVGGKRQKGTA